MRNLQLSVDNDVVWVPDIIYLAVSPMHYRLQKLEYNSSNPSPEADVENTGDTVDSSRNDADDLVAEAEADGSGNGRSNPHSILWLSATASVQPSGEIDVRALAYSILFVEVVVVAAETVMTSLSANKSLIGLDRIRAHLLL